MKGLQQLQKGKLRNQKDKYKFDELDVDEGHQPAYVFMDTQVPSTLLDELVKCPRCGFHVKPNHLIGNKKGH